RRAGLCQPRTTRTRGDVGPIGIDGSTAVTTVAPTARTPATADVAKLLSRLGFPTAGPEPAWLTQVRRASAEWATMRGFPTRKDEDWKYTRLGPLLDVPLERSGAGRPISPSIIDAVTIDAASTRLVFVNGRFDPESSKSTALPEGVTVTNLASVLAEGGAGLEPFFSRPFGEDDHAFTALNDCLFEDGACIRVAAGTVVSTPIELVFLSDAIGAPLMANPRSMILAGRDSRVAVVETYAGTSGAATCTNTVTQVVLDEGARVGHYRIQDEPDSGFHLALLDVRQGPGSRFSSGSVALGSRIARNEVHVRLEGEGAEVGIDGLYLPRGDQHHDNPVLIEHAAPRCVSRQLYKGIADERGHGVFNGRIVVWPDASGTDASQTNKNLLLSDDAEVDTRPRLEIFTDDVKCTHGAAVGALDEDALFYLRSRGVPHQVARTLLISAFAREMLDLIESASLRARMETLLADRLSTATASRGRRSGRR
ncbi:MAG: Fe-S cluster assembly protein SufD, partial [Acidimicrobiales bacterium]